MKRISIAAIAALVITAPAMACTDWKAVAAFDAIILERDKMAIADEKEMQGDPMCVNFRNGKIEFGDVAKWPKGSPAYRTAEWACVGADQVSQRHSDDVGSHLDSAMKDECK